MPGPVKWLIFWLYMIGTGSSLFHSFANRLTQALDVGPICIFVVSFLIIWNRLVKHRSLTNIAVQTLILTLLLFISLRLFPADVFGGSEGYLPVAVFMIAYGLQNYRDGCRPPYILIAAAAFLISLSMRSLDMPFCEENPVGLHFLWHSLNGVVTYLVTLPIIDFYSLKHKVD